MEKAIKLKILIILNFLYSGALTAQDGDKISYTTYYFNDSGNNSVITTAFSLAKQIVRGTAILLDIELDKVSIPPVDGASGATRPTRRSDETFEKNRGQIIIGIEQYLGLGSTLALNAYRSQELDYVSNSVIATYSQDLFQNNTTLTFRAQYNDDKVGELLDNGSLVNRKKTTYTGSASLGQVLSASTVLNLSYDYMQMEGFLSDPYRRVIVFNNNNVFETLLENHPDSRKRQSVSTRISQFVGPVNASLIGSYRYYFDDWDLTSHTTEFKFNKYVFDDLILGFSYRYYTQSGADFYSDRYEQSLTPDMQLRTADYKLKPFQSNTFGFNIRLLFREFSKNNPKWDFLNKSSFEIMYLRYTNDLDFSANILQGSLNFAL
ncbi:MAG: DUF3570 domain-containing protein [Calditrichae bacterium]|nr:DUF3570 domain-containing protein [Calditrichota bacterium]MCB9057437.1 DUF3570 domain-containing protein [Calditrichia bacterium]